MLARTLKVAALCALVFSLVAGVFAVQTQRRRRTSRRTTSPVRPAYVPAPSPSASPGDPSLVSTADEQQEDAGSARRSRDARRSPTPDPEATTRAVQQLSTQVTQLNKKVGDMEKQRRTDLIQERLTRAEQRVEQLQSQLSDVMEKEANLQARVEQLDDAMRPENLDRAVATVGTFRPDEARDALRRQYDNEKKRVQAQLEVQNTRHQQLEKSLSDATQLADRVRAELDDAMRREAETEGGTGNGAPNPPPPTPTVSPIPTPTPPM
ncbi:MAG: hypothetical protein LC746_02705 [Acidobacteria bacterium]|nr:hypothetical protein [Acidobacteriota bacterium]